MGKRAGNTVKEILAKPPARLGTLLIAVVIIIATGVVAFFTEQGAMEARNWVVRSYEVRHELGGWKWSERRPEQTRSAICCGTIPTNLRIWIGKPG